MTAIARIEARQLLLLDLQLDKVNNWIATAAVDDASNTKYATAGAVKKAYDLANSAKSQAGSADKLTTARTLTIGNSGKAFDGTANVAWSLAEMGALGVGDNAVSATKLATARTIGGVAFDGTANINLPGVNIAGNQNTTGNAATATKLATARTINGSSFDGAANVETSYWGTARTLTIGNTGKSVNGAANVAWSLAEMGAVNKAGDTITGAIRFQGDGSSLGELKATTIGNLHIDAGKSGTSGAPGQLYLNWYSGSGGVRIGNGAMGDAAIIHSSGAATFLGAVTAPSFSGALSGNADTTTKLATARTINGTSFDGSANVETSYWGAARTITIGSTSKSVNGAANVSWTLTEIGGLGSSNANGFWGMASPSGDTDNWIRTTRNGLLPAQSGGASNLGTSSWPFLTAYVNTIYEGGTALASKYLGISANAVSATKLATARTLTIGNTGKAFDGTANLAWSLAEMGAAEVAAGAIVIPALSGTSSATLKTQKDGSGGVDDKETWMTDKPTTVAGHKGIGIKTTLGPVYWNGTDQRRIYNEDYKPTAVDVGAIAKNTGNVLQNSGFGVGFLSSGVSGAQWIASYFGDNAATGGRVVVGTLTTDSVNPYATIGAHNASLTAWAPLAINPGADGAATVYVGMNPAATSGNGNLFVGNDIESNYMRLRSPIPNDNRYVVNKGYVDGKFAPIAHRGTWVDKGIHTQTAYGLGWNAYGNGHIICDASAGAIEGVSVPRTDAQIAWDNVNGATLVGWNGQSTFGVRVDRARLADAANWSAQSDRATYLNGTVATAGQDITIHGKRAIVGVGDANQLVLNYGNDWGSTLIVGHAWMQTVESNRHVVVHNGATAYANAGLEVRSTDGSDVRIGMHRSGHSAAAIVHNSWGFQFEREDSGSRANVAAANFFADAAQDSNPNALTRKDYVDGRLGEAQLFRSRGEPGNLNSAGANGVYRWAPGAVNIPIGNSYGHVFTFSDNGYFGDGAWASQFAHAHGNGLFYRTIVNGGFADWSKFMFDGGSYSLGEITVTSALSLGVSGVWGAHSATILKDHGNGNTTISGGRNPAGDVGDLYVGYNAPGAHHYTNNVRLCRQMVSDTNGLPIIGLYGDLYDGGQRVYSPNNKPTPDAIGAAAVGHTQWRLVAAGDVTVAMANHATGSLRTTIDTGINSAHGFVHDASKYRAVIYTNDITTSNPAACTWGAYGTLRALARWNGPHTIQLDIYSFGTSMTKGTIYRWEVYEVI